MAMKRRPALFATGRTMEILGLVIPLAGISYGMTAPEGSASLTIQFLAVGVGLAIFYAGRNLVSRAIH